MEKHLHPSERKKATSLTIRADDASSRVSSESSNLRSKTSKTPKTPTERLIEFGQEYLSPEKIKQVGKEIVEKAAMVVPKVQPIPWHTFIFLSIKVALPVIGYVLFFTTLGFGEIFFSYLADRYEQYSYVVGGVTSIFVFILYLLDITDWDSSLGKKLAMFFYLLFVCGFVILILFMTNLHPYGPMAFFAFLTPIWLIAIKGAFYSHIDARTYISWLSGPLLFVSVTIGLIWFAWTFLHDDNEWTDITRFTNADEAGCMPNFVEYPECESLSTRGEICVSYVKGVFKLETPAPTSAPGLLGNDEAICPRSCQKMFHNCLNTFILWVGPLMASMILFFLSFFSTFLKSDHGERDFINFAKLWIFLLFTVWVTSSLAGVAAGVASALLALTLASFVGSAVFISASVSYSDQKGYLFGLWNRIIEKYSGWLDIARGLAVAILLPLWFVYLVLSFLNQRVRRLGLKCSKKIKSEEEKADFYTRATRRQIKDVRTWDLSTIFVYAVYWGAGFVIMNVVVAKLTVLFLSWLIEKTGPLGLGATTGIMILVGIIMFLLPPVPGPPIYLTAGIVLLAAGRPVLGIAGSIIYGCVVSFVLKLLACSMQQKAIGERMSKSIAIRKAVSINSDLIKCSRLILMEKGFTAAKIGLLCGGPDWPTSVFCGILKLDLFPILLGTIPVIIIIIFMVLTGAFTYMSSLEVNGEPEFPFAPIISTIMAAIAALVQFAAMIIAAYYLELTFNTRKEEIDAIENDEEVKAIEEKQIAYNECYKVASKWTDLPLLPKLLMKSSLFFMVTCTYLVQLFSKECFAPYQLTYTIDKHLGGDWTNLFLPLGQIACFMFIISCGLLVAFKKWVSRAAKVLYENDGPEDEEKAPDDDIQKEETIHDFENADSKDQLVVSDRVVEKNS